MKWPVLVLLLVASSVTARVVFGLLDDPEGPNLFVVGALTIVIFAVSALAYLLLVKRAQARRLGAPRRHG